MVLKVGLKLSISYSTTSNMVHKKLVTLVKPLPVVQLTKCAIDEDASSPIRAAHSNAVRRSLDSAARTTTPCFCSMGAACGAYTPTRYSWLWMTLSCSFSARQRHA